MINFVRGFVVGSFPFLFYFLLSEGRENYLLHSELPFTLRLCFDFLGVCITIAFIICVVWEIDFACSEKTPFKDDLS